MYTNLYKKYIIKKKQFPIFSIDSADLPDKFVQ